jgi:hypothetical protein
MAQNDGAPGDFPGEIPIFELTVPSTVPGGNVFDNLAGMGGPLGLMGIAMQIPDVLAHLSEVLGDNGSNPDAAAANPGLVDQVWAEAAGETRAAILLSAAWQSRAHELPESENVTAAQYAAQLHDEAAAFTGDSEAWHGVGFPAMPYPGTAGKLASGLGMDQEDVYNTMVAALIMGAAIPRDGADDDGA